MNLSNRLNQTEILLSQADLSNLYMVLLLWVRADLKAMATKKRLHTSQRSRMGVSSPNTVKFYSQDTRRWIFLLVYICVCVCVCARVCVCVCVCVDCFYCSYFNVSFISFLFFFHTLLPWFFLQFILFYSLSRLHAFWSYSYTIISFWHHYRNGFSLFPLSAFHDFNTSSSSSSSFLLLFHFTLLSFPLIFFHFLSPHCFSSYFHLILSSSYYAFSFLEVLLV